MIKGKVAIVTGAGGGVGKAISKRLSSEGCKVVMLGRGRTKLQKAASEIGNKKNTMTVIADIAKEAEVLSAIDQTINSFDKIDILVNNAGIINDPMPFHEMTEDQWDDLVKTNLFGTFKMTQAVIPVMMKNGGGSIVNISSVLGIRAIPKVPLFGVRCDQGRRNNVHKEHCSRIRTIQNSLQLRCSFYYPKFNNRALSPG